jgi:hypothetical protein
LKASINCVGGFRNSMTMLLGGTDLERKAAIVEDQLFDALGGRAQFSHADVRLERMDEESPRANEESVAHLKVTVMSPDEKRVGRRFANAVVELALSSVPGFSARTPPGDATPYLVFWPALIDRRHIEERVHLGDESVVVPPPPTAPWVDEPVPPEKTSPAAPPGPMVRVRLGRLFGARSGDKGGNANLGLWARDDASFVFLENYLTSEELKRLCPDFGPFAVTRHTMANLRAVHFVIHGLLGEGVAASARIDPQAKTLAEYVRAVFIEVPASLLQ